MLYIFAGPAAAVHGEYGAQTDPFDAGSALIIIKDTIPRHHAGIADNAPVSDTASCGILIESVSGIDLTDSENIRFEIDDGVHGIYERDLGSDSVRVVKLNDDADSSATRLWIVYDRFLDNHLPDTYAFDAHVSIRADIRDKAGNVRSIDSFEFKIESEAAYLAGFRNLPQTAALEPSDPMLDEVYDSGIQVVAGPLEGTRIIYNSSEPLPPVFGPLDAVTAVDADDLETIGVPINLKPHTVFDIPVKLYIPVPDHRDEGDIGIYYHDGQQWLYACDPDGRVLDDGLGWMKPGTRVTVFDHGAKLIGIDVHHFSAVQSAVVFAQFNGTRTDDPDDTRGSNATVYVSCFISSTANDNSPGFLSLLVGLLPLFVGLLLLGSRFKVHLFRIHSLI